jgi:serine/threonine protein kinase
MKKMNKVYSEEDLINIIYQISICLDILEKRHLCHFNINPKNILVFKNKIYKLTDLEYVKDLNETNIIDNYNNFISPQLFSYFYGKENKKFVDLIKNDVYSLGLCIIYTMTKNDDYNNLYNNFVVITINDNDKLIDEYLKYPLSILSSENKYSNKFIYLLKKMLKRDEKERFNFNEIKKYLCKEYEFE